MKVLDQVKGREIKEKLTVMRGSGNSKAKMIDLDSVKIGTTSEEDLRQQALERRAYAEKAGALIIKIRTRLRQLKLATQVGLLSLDEEAELGDLSSKENAILQSCDEALRKYVGLRVLIEEIYSSKRDRVFINGLLGQIVKNGWYRIATAEEKITGWHKGKWPEGTILGFNQAVYFLNPVLSKSFADELSAAFDKAIKGTVAAEEEHERKEIVRLKTAGDPDLFKLKSGVAGDYVIVFPGGNRIKEGAGIVSMCQREITIGEKPVWSIVIVDGAGSLAWLRENKGQFIPYVWTIKGIPEKVSGDKKMLAEELIGAINSSVKFQRGREEKK